MKFVISDKALNGGDLSLASFDRLVDRVADEVHKFDFPGADLLEESQWYTSARSTRKKLVSSMLAMPPVRPVHEIHRKSIVVDSPEKIDSAVKAAYSPLVILVEDREADGVFLDLIMSVLGADELKDLWARGKKVIPSGYELTNSGGLHAIPQRISRLIKDSAAAGVSPRIMVLCDSDKRWPGDTENMSYRKIEEIKQVCLDAGAALHILEKRCIENYLPNEVYIEARKKNPGKAYQALIDALLRRTSQQRDHLPVKSFLTESEHDAGELVGFYTPSERSDLELFRERIFPPRPRVMLQMLNNYQACFTEKGLRERDGRDELGALLNTISGEL
ncbi:hypothetical protein K4L06_09230 [Lysobacter sp. BMK333-48F3]|uniref:hypothetical protein n=1 Tax=Lysobacter sp. BMK333-48F3 TaxID=2867962 RepID=UPI001C8C5E97|nr:hypothetical protein [Lysobacter sp. BMK333-48F3]MBX9401494.1 hypothetical protein [Lysobacter sp. BMK333-48F3]